MALVAYRNLFRAARIAFQGDAPLLVAAHSQIRNEFRQKSNLDISDRGAAIQHAEDVARILRENVVQGKRVNDENQQYKLRIHEHTEKGDNDSIKTSGVGAVLGGGCCGGGGSK